MGGNNNQNLRVPTSEEARINGRKGGIASAAARRKKKELVKTAKQIVEALFEETGKIKVGGKMRNLTVKEIILRRVINKAVKDGSLAAIDMLLSLVGENPKNAKIDITGFNITVADKKAKDAIEDL